VFIPEEADTINQIKCNLCDDKPAGLFSMPKGCVCSPDILQYLCMQHVVRATPLGGMYLLEILNNSWKDELIERFGNPLKRKID
jgi:hypothetical protein